MKYIGIIGCIFLLIASCGTGGNKSAKEYLSAYLNDNNEVIAFGNSQLETILVKADLSTAGGIGGIVLSEMDSLKTVIDLESPVFYAVTGPLKGDGSPTSTTVFINVLDQDKLEKKLLKMGYDLNEENGVKVAEDGDVELGLKDNLAIIQIAGKDIEAIEMAELFKKANGKASGGKVDEILSQEADIVLGMNMNALLETSNGEVVEMDEERKKKVSKLTDDSYFQTTVQFEDGEAIIKMDNLFNDELSNRMFMTSDSDIDFRKELGQGEPRAGLAINLDFGKAEELANEIAEEEIKEMTGMRYKLVKSLVQAKDLGDILNGNIGAVMFGDVVAGEIDDPQFNAYLGMRPKARDVSDLISAEAGALIPGNLEVGEDGVSISSSEKYKGNQGLVLPSEASDFGKPGITFFLNLEGIDASELGLIEPEELNTIMKVVEFVWFEYGNDGGELRLKAKDGKENVLKQAVELLVDDFADQMKNISI